MEAWRSRRRDSVNTYCLSCLLSLALAAYLLARPAPPFSYRRAVESSGQSLLSVSDVGHRRLVVYSVPVVGPCRLSEVWLVSVVGHRRLVV